MTFKVNYVLSVFIVDITLKVLAADNVAESFIANEIVPDVVETPPTSLANVLFPNGFAVNLGNELTPSQVQDTPTVQWNASSDVYYTLVFGDPDAPSRSEPIYRQWLHWLVVNIPGDNVANGTTLAQFMSSAPEVDTGLHRYVFLVFSQPSLINFEEADLDSSRGGFSPAAFAKKYDFAELVAGNHYAAQFEN